tara:strand:+ start:1728 stop:4304 length:2577 start_codon:yes stop_codon:yes gene_type:complete
MAFASLEPLLPAFSRLDIEDVKVTLDGLRSRIVQRQKTDRAKRTAEKRALSDAEQEYVGRFTENCDLLVLNKVQQMTEYERLQVFDAIMDVLSEWAQQKGCPAYLVAAVMVPFQSNFAFGQNESDAGSYSTGGKGADWLRILEDRKIKREFWTRAINHCNVALESVARKGSLSWDKATLAKRLLTKGVFSDYPSKNAMDTAGATRGAYTAFGDTTAKRIAQRLMKLAKGPMDSLQRLNGADALSDDELAFLRPVVYMQSVEYEQTPGSSHEPQEYLLSSVEILLSECDGLRNPRWSKVRKEFMGVSDPYDEFRGYSIFPQTYRDYTDTEDYFLTRKSRADATIAARTYPESLCSYWSYYLDGIDDIVETTNHADAITWEPRLSRSAIKAAAEYCNRNMDYFTVLEWSSILVQMARERAPPTQLGTLPNSDMRVENAPFLATGCAYENDFVPAELTKEAWYHMEVRIKWEHNKSKSQSPPPNERVVDVRSHVNVLPKETGPQRHWISWIASMRTWDKNKQDWMLYINESIGDNTYKFKFGLERYHDDVNLMVMASSNTCIKIDFTPRFIHLDLLFWSTKEKKACDLNWSDELESGFARSVLRILYDAAIHQNVPLELLDGSHTPNYDDFVTPRPIGRRFYLFGKDADDDMVGFLTATLIVTRGYGYYESMGLFSKTFSNPNDPGAERRYAQERLNYQHLIATTPIKKLKMDVTTYQETLSKYEYPGGVNSDDSTTVFGIDSVLSAIDDLNVVVEGLAVPPINVNMSLRQIAQNINDGKADADAARAFMVDAAPHVRNLMTRKARTNSGEIGFYPGGNLQVNFYSFSGIENHKVRVFFANLIPNLTFVRPLLLRVFNKLF